MQPFLSAVVNSAVEHPMTSTILAAMGMQDEPWLLVTHGDLQRLPSGTDRKLLAAWRRHLPRRKGDHDAAKWRAALRAVLAVADETHGIVARNGPRPTLRFTLRKGIARHPDKEIQLPLLAGTVNSFPAMTILRQFRTEHGAFVWSLGKRNTRAMTFDFKVSGMVKRSSTTLTHLAQNVSTIRPASLVLEGDCRFLAHYRCRMEALRVTQHTLQISFGSTSEQRAPHEARGTMPRIDLVVPGLVGKIATFAAPHVVLRKVTIDLHERRLVRGHQDFQVRIATPGKMIDFEIGSHETITDRLNASDVLDGLIQRLLPPKPGAPEARIRPTG